VIWKTAGPSKKRAAKFSAKSATLRRSSENNPAPPICGSRAPPANRFGNRRGSAIIQDFESTFLIRRSHARANYFFFFVERDGITLATALATPDAIFATTPFFGFRFVFEAAGRLLLFVAGLDFDFAFVLVFVPFFTIADSSTPRPIS